MTGSSTTRRGIKAAGLACLAWFSIGAAEAQIRFDQLTRCAEISQLWSRMDAGHALSGCRQPSTPIERAMASRAFPMGGACILSQAPTPALSSFSCLNASDPRDGIFNGVICVREASAADVASYEDRYDTQYASAALDYISRASDCAEYNNDAAPTGAGMFSIVSKFVAKPEFGFATQRGGGRKGTVLHGYASLDPQVAGAGRAIEVVEAFVGGDVAFGLEKGGKTFGAWRVEVDDMNDADTQVNAMFRNAQFPARVNFSDIEISRDKPLKESRAKKRERMDAWVEVMDDLLGSNGLFLMTDEDLREKKTSYAQMREKLLEGQPYGQRAMMAESAGKFLIFADDTLAECVEPDGLLLSILTTYAEPVLKAGDYGSIGLITFGLGSCSTSRAATEMRRILADVTNEFSDFLEDEE